ncbi:MAG: zinc metallopeptidase [Clostridia bacterium]|nr:zinc metallopeptidase [Clostridia bacterium]
MPHYYYYGFDIYYLILILPAFILSLGAQIMVSSTFSKYSKSINMSGLTGAAAAQRVLYSHGVTNVRIERVGGNLTDHFDPRTNVIRLSDSVYASTSVAAIGVAAHEAGHAVQYAQSYAPIKIRNFILPVVNFGSRFSFIAILLGIAFAYDLLITIGIILFSFATLFQILTLPVELNASKRAMETIRGQALLSDTEARGAKKVLTAAAMTYVAAVVMSIAQLLRLLLLNRRRR